MGYSTAPWASFGEALGRRQLQQPPGLRGQGRQLPREALLDPPVQRYRAAGPEPARQLRRRQPPRQLQQRSRIVPGQALHHELGQPGHVLARDPRREHQAHRVGRQPPRREPQRLRRGPVQPLLVIDHADQRAFPRRPGQQAQHGQSHHEPVRRRARSQAERGPQRLTLRTRKRPGMIQHRRAQLMQPREGQLHLRLHPRRPRHLEEIITCSLAGLGPSGRTVRVDLPPGLPKVVADPPVMERVIANLTANALLYSPSGSPPRLTASARSGRIELRVIDCGPGVPAADRDRMFAPFQRLGDTGSTTGVGLGLAVSRGLTEAMRGTLQPARTPGGGLTMTMSLPAAPRPTRSSRCSCCDRLLRARAWSPSRRTLAGRHARRSGRMRWVYSSAMRAACQLNAPPRLTLEAICRNHRFPRLR